MKLVIDKILNLEDGEHRFQFECKAAEIGLLETDFEGNEIFPDLLLTDIVLTKTGHTFYMNIKSHTLMHTMCDRCLSVIQQEVSGAATLVYTNSRHQNSKDHDDELRTIDIRQNNSIGIDKDVRNMLILSLPTKTLCRPDCRGLCAQCGADWNSETCEHKVEKRPGVLA